MLKTEMRNPNTMHIDRMTSREMVAAMARENYRAAQAVEEQSEVIAQVVDLIAEAFNTGHRLFFIGCGTSGRLGVLDAVECPPTFGADTSMVQGIIAGGEKRMFAASENEEDKDEKGREDVIARGVSTGDVVVGVSVAGGAAYVVGGLQQARALGAATVALTCNENSPIGAVSDLCIVTDTGAEVITGSTRMKAGTAQKIILNMLSTVAMIKLGNVYENMMINLRPSNEKLTLRMIRIVTEIIGVKEEEARKLLEESNWDIRTAVRKHSACNER